MRINPVDSEVVVANTKSLQFKSKPESELETESEEDSKKSSNKNLLMGVGAVAAAAVAAYALVKSHKANNELKELKGKFKELEGKNKDLTSKLEEANKQKPKAPEAPEAPKKPEAPKPQPNVDEAAKLAERKAAIQNAEEFSFTMDGNTFTVKNGKVVECKNDKGEIWTESYLNPNNDGAKEYQGKVNAKLNDILEGKYSDEVTITKIKTPETKPDVKPEDVKPETKPEEVKPETTEAPEKPEAPAEGEAKVESETKPEDKPEDKSENK